MSLLTEQEITGIANNDALWDDGKYLGEATLNEYRYARAIESAVIEKIKAQGATIWSCDVLQSDATFKSELSTIEPPTNYYSIRNVKAYYRLPEGE